MASGFTTIYIRLTTGGRLIHLAVIMVLLTTVTSAAEQSPPDVKATTSSSSDMDSFDKAVVAGVTAAVFLTLVIVVALIAIYLYKHKGSYHTHETDEEGEAHKALQMNSDSGEEKQEYLM